MKKGILLIGGLLSLFTLASCNEETKIEYRDRIVEVEVEKPVEVIKEVEVVKEVEVPVEVEKTVYVDKPVEKIVEKEVKVEVPVEKVVEVEKTVYVEKSQVDLNGVNAVKLGDNLYQIEFDASNYLNAQKVFDFKGIYTNGNYQEANYKYFERGELVSKPGYIIKDISLFNSDRMAAPYILDEEYNNILPNNGASYNSIDVRYIYSNINKENITIKFRHLEAGSTLTDYGGARKIKVTFAINSATYIRPEADQIIYGYAGLQINNSDCIYKRGYVGETVTSEELENFILSLYPKCKIVTKNYSTFTTTYDAQCFTTRKIWIERVS